MRTIHGRTAILASAAVAALFLVPSTVSATEIFVDCNAGQTIGDALNILDSIGPHTLAVNGTCHEAVSIANRHSVAIQGNAATIVSDSTTVPVITVSGSHNIAITGVTLTGGGVGLRVARGSVAAASNIKAQGNAHSGITVDSSFLQLEGAIVSQNNGGNGIFAAGARIFLSDEEGPNILGNNGGNGIALADGSKGSFLADTTIQGNGGAGIVVFHTSFLVLAGATVDGNGDTGVDIQETSHGELASCTISNNGGVTAGGGLRVADNSDLYIDGGIAVTNNTGVGVEAELDGQLSSLGGNTIAGNTRDGVRVRRMGLGHFFAPDVIVGNGGHAVVCDDTSLVVGDLTGISKVKCSNIDREIAPATPTARHHGPE